MVFICHAKEVDIIIPEGESMETKGLMRRIYFPENNITNKEKKIFYVNHSNSYAKKRKISFDFSSVL